MNVGVLSCVGNRHMLGVNGRRLVVLFYLLVGLNIPIFLLDGFSLDATIHKSLVSSDDLSVVITLYMDLELSDSLLHDEVLSLHLIE